MTNFENRFDLYNKARATWGKKSMMHMLAEEASELCKAALKSVRRYNGSVPSQATEDALVDEIADVEIMCEQARGCFDISEKIEQRKRFKIDRLSDRLNSAKGIPEIICLCGSSRFVSEMAVIAWEFEKDGKIVLGLHLLPADYPGVPTDHLAEAEGVAARMDELHLRKIDLADRVLVVDIGGYIGESTSREILYAEKNGKPVRYLEPLSCESKRLLDEKRILG